MRFQIHPSAEDSSRYVELIAQTLEIRRHLQLLHWLQGDVQAYVRHEIFLTGWGSFEEGVIRHDVLSELPGARSYAVGTEGLPFLLGRCHERWVSAGREPLMLSFREFDHLLGSVDLPGTFNCALRTMRSVLVHGLRDERSGHESIYLMLSATDIEAGNQAGKAGTAIRVLLPAIDAAMRRVAPMPQQCANPRAQSGMADEASGLTEREAEIMAWVAMGKTNPEIGSILNISGFTVKNHMQRIFQKLNVLNRAQAVSKINQVALRG